MNRTVFRLSVEQILVTNNRVFDAELASELQRLGYSSKYWITQAYCHALDMLPKPSEYKKGHKTSISREWVYNAEQMPENVNITSLCESNTPRMAISGRPICGKYAAILNARKDISNNQWIRKEVIDSLGVHILSGSESVTVEHEKNEKTETIELYNIDHIEESDLLLKAARHTNISAMLAEELNIKDCVPFIRSSISRQFSTPVWVANEYLGHIGVSVKVGEEPTIAGQAGSSLKYTEYPNISYFNVEQIDDQEKVMEYIQKMQRVPLCASTGQRYPQDIELHLISLQNQSPHFSRYWLDVRQACSIGVSIISETGVPVTLHGKEMIIYNTSQTDSPLAAFVAARNYRHLYKMSSRVDILTRPSERW
ncbi:F-type H+-transporting ATPase beta chain [Perkinsela sp. CCAP 1560/4]|nr:F-type H+-transporting ATPase beta chain [Perkinsela sp. CCAP 1560/4]|eukprot:KNH05611.1 F-type H+-transporting ATPase beta chain [Perkinsela sp. CCAP 1560/4]